MSDSDDSCDSDKELQAAWRKGLLQGKLAVEATAPRTHINNVPALKEALVELHTEMPWIERLDLTLDPTPPPRAMLEQLGPTPDDLSGDEVHNDFKREMKFHRQAQAAVLEAIPRLHSLGVPTRRPDDNFAEMVKTDDHMKRVREKLQSSQLSAERSENAKKLRMLKKFGKKVQQEVAIKRQKEKKEMVEAVKKYRKGHTTSLDFLDDDKKSKQNRSHPTPAARKNQLPGKKRQEKNAKFGYGGQKKRSKYNTKESSDDMPRFPTNKHAKSSKTGQKNRPGKTKRQKQKGKKKN